ncbi:glycosyltransferase [Flavobacterium sp. Fl-77]|uniref:Glycosyltransferase n=1 Tax=Flavobacterium flavipigmentatum TaxID=2893884 RepID=A0AAJ2SGJ3_9FLAO|nr:MULTISPECIES: glycosyltransferase [unclassified Flavobacterium]MDX6182228.1 glycosyltransferase [Flavobacterium sp. Fl-33]MDX6185859.1 glycosyltransferase [Flavobacterium sp. Fl-77]UFH39038.1 glycosyltransferase [Flavobacterium sp. F-70]
MYHKIHPDTPTMWWVSVNEFYRQMVELSNKKVVYLNDYDCKNENHVVITFDGIYKNIYEYALPILKHFNYPFELFLTSDYVGYDNSFDSVEPLTKFTNSFELLKLVEGGGRLQWHTKSHPNLKNVSDLEVIIEELTVPEEIKILDINGFDWFAYPHGEFNDLVVNEVKLRFRGALSCNQGDEFDKYRFNRLTVENHTSLKKNTIACIIPCYNYGRFLIEAIESVIKQTIIPDEILISDDCSTDETQIIAQEYVKKFPGLIKYNRNETNLGIVKHFNEAIKLTKADFIFFLGADNRLLSNYVEECIKILNKSEEIGIAYTDYTFFGPRAKMAYELLPDFRHFGIINNSFFKVFFPETNSRFELLDILNQSNIIHGSSMFKRTAYDSVQGYIQSEMPEDYNLFKRIVEKGWDAKKAKNTNLEYRQHSDSQANNVLSLQKLMLFYKDSYLSLKKEKNDYENSKVFRISYKLYRFYRFIKRNYNNPRKIFKRILKIK